MACKNTVSTTKTTVDKKTGAQVKTYNTTRKCSNNALALEQDEEEKESDVVLLEDEPEEEKSEDKPEMTMEEIKENFDRLLNK